MQTALPAGVRVLTRASAIRCQSCPPERVCAWACVQGAGMEEIVVGAALAERLAALQPEPRPEDIGFASAGIWECYNI